MQPRKLNTYKTAKLHWGTTFGSGIAERGKNFGGNYRFGMNTQEKETELGEGITSAEFWFYDGKLRRRWNVDPKRDLNQGSYSVFKNSPILSVDINGDTTFVYGSCADLITTINDNKPNAIVFYTNEVANVIAANLNAESFETTTEKQAYLNEVAEILRDPISTEKGSPEDLAIISNGFLGTLTSETATELRNIALKSENSRKEHAISLSRQTLTGGKIGFRLQASDLGSGTDDNVDIRGKIGPNWNGLILGHTHPENSPTMQAHIKLANGYNWSKGKKFNFLSAPSYEKYRNVNDYEPQKYRWVNDLDGNSQPKYYQSMMIIVTQYGFSLYLSDASKDVHSGFKRPGKDDKYLYSRFQ